jgi:hypothetical protein
MWSGLLTTTILLTLISIMYLSACTSLAVPAMYPLSRAYSHLAKDPSAVSTARVQKAILESSPASRASVLAGHSGVRRRRMAEEPETSPISPPGASSGSNSTMVEDHSTLVPPGMSGTALSYSSVPEGYSMSSLPSTTGGEMANIPRSSSMSGTTEKEMTENSLFHPGASEGPSSTVAKGYNMTLSDVATRCASARVKVITYFREKLGGSVVSTALFNLEGLSDDEISAKYRGIATLVDVMSEIVSNSEYEVKQDELEVVKDFFVEESRRKHKQIKEAVDAFIGDLRSNSDIRRAMREYKGEVEKGVVPPGEVSVVDGGSYKMGLVKHFREKMKGLLGSKGRNFFGNDFIEVGIRYTWIWDLIDVVGKIADDSKYEVKQDELGVIEKFFVTEDWYETIWKQWANYIERLRSNPNSKRVVKELNEEMEERRRARINSWSNPDPEVSKRLRKEDLEEKGRIAKSLIEKLKGWGVEGDFIGLSNNDNAQSRFLFHWLARLIAITNEILK